MNLIALLKLPFQWAGLMILILSILCLPAFVWYCIVELLQYADPNIDGNFDPDFLWKAFTAIIAGIYVYLYFYTNFLDWLQD